MFAATLKLYQDLDALGTGHMYWHEALLCLAFLAPHPPLWGGPMGACFLGAGVRVSNFSLFFF